MRVAVAGGTGVVGARTVDALREAGHEAVVLSRSAGVDLLAADADAVAGDCSLANGGIVLETGRTPMHPLSLVARAYGLPAPTAPR